MKYLTVGYYIYIKCETAMIFLKFENFDRRFVETWFGVDISLFPIGSVTACVSLR